MSRTMIMLSWLSSKIPSPMTFSAVEPYPCVRNAIDAATRPGVLRSPSRPGSSPRSSSCLRTRSSKSLFAGIFDIVVFGFPQYEPREPGRLHPRGEDLPERDHDVLGGLDHSFHERHVEIEVLVIDVIDDFALDDR